MIKGIYQSCYTNTETAGWTSVAVSPDIPNVAAEFCTKNIHGKNSSFDKSDVDEKNNTLNLFECDSDGIYIYLTHTQYGLVSRGRPNMFAHTYVFPWNEELITNPGLFLSFADSNFRDNESDANSDIQPSYLEPFSLVEIITKYGLTKDNLTVLIGAVINQFTKKKENRVPLFIQYDGTERQLKELLYLIYRFVPRYMRKQICAASCECSNTKDTPIVFSIRASTKRSYVDVFNGNNNVLDEAGIKKLKRSGYSVYPVENYDTTDIEKYFCDLEKMTEEFTGSDTANRAILQVCHKICIGKSVEDMDENSAINLFFDVLGVDSQTDFYFDYLARCLKKAIECDLSMTEDAERVLLTKLKLNDKEESEFHRIYMDYEVSKISNMSDNDAVAYLCHLDNDLSLPVCKAYLNKYPDDQHKKIIEDYYKKHRLKANTFDGLSSVIEEMLSINYLVTDDLIVYLKDKASECYFSYIFNADIEFFEKYKKLLISLYNDDNPERRVREAKADFWKRLSFKQIKFDKLDFYDYMADGCDTDEAWMYLKYIALPKFYREEGIAAYIGNAFAFFNNETFLRLYSEEGRTESVDVLVKCLAPYTNDEGARIRSYTNIATADAGFVKAVDAIADLLEKVEQHCDFQTAIKLFDKAREMISASVHNKGPFLSSETSTSQNILKVNLTAGLISELHDRESNGEVVPLDLWLYIGDFSISYGNPFRLLEEEYPRVLTADPEKVYMDSRCLKDSDYINRARNYLTKAGDSGTADVVKSWIKLYQNGGKLKSDNEEKDASNPDTVPQDIEFVEVSRETPTYDTPVVAIEPSASEPTKESEDKKAKKGLGGILGGLFKKG